MLTSTIEQKKEKKKKNMNTEKIMKGVNKQKKKLKKEENEGLMLGHRCLLNIACLS